MRMKTTMNMTEGRPLALLSVFALPLLIGNLFQQAYNLADSMIVGRLLGADALAAVGATGSISFLFFFHFQRHQRRMRHCDSSVLRRQKG